jgi:uncharacterized protein YcnI
MKKRFLAGTVLALLSLSSVAHAHVTVQPSEAPAGSFFAFVVRVPNEREDAATTEVTVRFPEVFASVSFQPKPGWQREVSIKKLKAPITIGDAEVDELVGSVTWTGGEIQPGEFDEFGFSVRVPDEPGEIEFKAIQTYSNGEVVEWTGPADAEEPAARVTAVALPAEEGQGQLAVLAAVTEEVDAMSGHQPAADDVEDDDAETNTGVVLGGIGTGLGALALIVALTKKRA